MRLNWHRFLFACDRSAYRCHSLCIREVANLCFSTKSNTYGFTWVIFYYEHKITLNLVK